METGLWFKVSSVKLEKTSTKCKDTLSRKFLINSLFSCHLYDVCKQFRIARSELRCPNSCRIFAVSIGINNIQKETSDILTHIPSYEKVFLKGSLKKIYSYCLFELMQVSSSIFSQVFDVIFVL